MFIIEKKMDTKRLESIQFKYLERGTLVTTNYYKNDNSFISYKLFKIKPTVPLNNAEKLHAL